MGELSKTIFVDPNMEAYDSLMQNPAGETLRKAAEGTRLERPMFDLLAAWRLIDCARVLPHVLASAIPGATTGAAMAKVPKTPEYNPEGHHGPHGARRDGAPRP